MAFVDDEEAQVTRAAILRAIKASAEAYEDPMSLLHLAEAWAWLVRPNPGHGSE
jgi:hypothetical protein